MRSDDSSATDREARRAEYRRRARAAASKALDAFLDDMWGGYDGDPACVCTIDFRGPEPRVLDREAGCPKHGYGRSESQLHHNRHYGAPCCHPCADGCSDPAAHAEGAHDV